MKKILVLFTAFGLAMSLIAFNGEARAATTQTLRTSVDMYNYIFQNYSSPVGPISITKGTLTTGSGTRTVYLIALSGTQIKHNQATGIINDFESGFSIESAYLNDVVNAILSNVPAGSNLVLAGHSLGGMVAQQVASNSTIKSKYNILNTVTFGSPLLGWLSREGATQRLGDINDVVPYLSVSTLWVVTLTWEVCGLNMENGGYGLNLLAAHIKSYANATEWWGWNALGYYNRTGYLTLNLSTKKQIPAPAGWTFFTY